MQSASCLHLQTISFIIKEIPLAILSGIFLSFPLPSDIFGHVMVTVGLQPES